MTDVDSLTYFSLFLGVCLMLSLIASYGHKRDAQYWESFHDSLQTRLNEAEEENQLLKDKNRRLKMLVNKMYGKLR